MQNKKQKQSFLSDSDEENGSTLKINKEFAKKYQEKKEKEDLSRLKALDSSEDEEVSEDENGKFDKPGWDTTFLSLLPQIQSGSLDTKEEYFPTVKEEPEEGKKKEKALYVHDYLQKRLLEDGPEGMLSDEEEEEEEKGPRKKHPTLSQKAEEKKLKKEFWEAVRKEDEEEEEDLLTLRKKGDLQTKGKRAKKPEDSFMSSEWMKKFWKAEDIDENEKFLRDYIFEKKWIRDPSVPTYEEIIEDDEEDDDLLQQQDEFEKKYNFRFEEKGGTELETHPRNVDSARRETNNRKVKRKEKRENKKAEKEKKQEELKRLKNLKKKEIMEKLKEIETITGTKAFDAEDLEGEFDPEEYDKKSRELFNDDFYSKEELEKPVFDDVPIMDDQYEEKETDPEGNPVVEGSAVKGAKKKARKAWKLAHKAATSQEHKETLDRYLEEYYKLNYEDIIDGTIPCRFNYIKVRKNRFGIRLSDMLELPEKELNQRVSIKKLAPYREERKKKRKRNSTNEIKEEEEEEEKEPMESSNSEKKQKKTANRDRKKRQKLRKREKLAEQMKEQKLSQN